MERIYHSLSTLMVSTTYFDPPSSPCGQCIYRSMNSRHHKVNIHVDHCSKLHIYLACLTVVKISTLALVIDCNRKRLENLILASLWLGEGKPKMSCYMQPLLNSLIRLELDGTSVFYSIENYRLSEFHLVGLPESLPPQKFNYMQVKA